MKTCRVPGCARRTTGWNVYCSTHHTRARRHGHPEQQGVTAADLKLYLAAVERRIRRNADSPAWKRIEARWLAVVDASRALLGDVERGRPYVRHQRIAAQEVVKLADAVPAEEVMKVALAVIMMADAEPRRFRSDEAMLTQLTRRVRALCDLNVGTWWSQADQRVKRVYRDLTPRAALATGRALADAFGAPGLYLARLEREGREAKQRENEALHEALRGLS